MQKSNANGRFFIDLTIRWHAHEWLLWGRLSSFLGEGRNVGNRRTSPVGGCPATVS